MASSRAASPSGSSHSRRASSAKSAPSNARIHITGESVGTTEGGILTQVLTEIEIEADDGEPVNGGDAVFAAVLAAAWRHAVVPRASVNTSISASTLQRRESMLPTSSQVFAVGLGGTPARP